MAYTKNVWVDQNVQRPKTYEVTNNADGSVTLTDSFGVVTEIGTPVNAVNMNHIENGIADNDTAISTINGKIPSNASSSNKMAVASDIAAIITALTLKADKTTLHALKSYLDEGELLTDAEGLADVIKYAHSTFDASKFTKVGSPIVTNNGIASGFSSSNYIYGNTSDVVTQISSSNNWSITSKTYTKDLLSSIPIFGFGANNTPNNDYPMSFINTYGTLKLRIKPSGDANVTELNWSGILSQLSANEYITVTISYKNGHYYCDIVKQNGTVLTHDFGSYGNTTFLGNYVKFTVFNADSGNIGSTDLKQFSITVDGVPVFSGNKTGIDTIKPDDYTVVGSPTISADGIASGFSSSNNLEKAITITSSNSFDVDFDVDTSTTLTNIGFLILRESGADRVMVDVGESGNVLLRYYNGSSIQYVSSNTTLTANTKHNLKVSYANGTLALYIDGVQKATTSSFSYGTITKCVIGSTTNASLTSGSIDLNAFKIYVDGNLVYQPCLKIPYTESAEKYGSKIVDAVYRDRVKDAWEQNYLQRYYTLDEANGNFTLPCGEIYGMITKASDGSQCMPSDTAINLTLGASDSNYTAPANGLVQLTLTSKTDAISAILLATTVNGSEEGLCMKSVSPIGYGDPIDVFLPVRKGDTFRASYFATEPFGTSLSDRFQFIYSVGSESEAT